MPSPRQDHYAVLGVDRTAAEADIVHAYRVLIRTWHPDIAGPAGAAKTAAINHAYDVLHDPAARRDYDLSAGTSAPEEVPAESASPVEPRVRGAVWTLIGLGMAGGLLFGLSAAARHSPADGTARTLITIPALLGFAWALVRRRRKWLGWPWLLLPAVVWVAAQFPGLVRGIPEAVMPRAVLAGMAAASVVGAVFLAVLSRAKKSVFKIRDIRAWERLRRASSVAPFPRVYWVVGVNNRGTDCDALLEDAGTGAETSRTLRGTCRQGTWILVDPAGRIIGSARDGAPAAWSAAGGR